MTPLGFARERCIKEMAELLASKGAKDAGHRTGDRWTAQARQNSRRAPVPWSLASV